MYCMEEARDEADEYGDAVIGALLGGVGSYTLRIGDTVGKVSYSRDVGCRFFISTTRTCVFSQFLQC